MLGARFERFVYAILILGAFALVALTLSPGLKAPTVDSGLAALVPADSVALLGVRLAELRATPLWPRFLAAPPAAQLETVARNTGFDFRSNLTDIVLTSNGREGVVLTRGSYRRTEIEGVLQRNGGYRMGHLNWTLIGNEENAVTFVDDSRTLAGPAPLVRSVLSQTGRSGPFSSPLLTEADRIARGNQVWLVAVGGIGRLASRLPRGSLPNMPGPFLELVDAVSFGADFRSGLEATAFLTCRSEQDTQTLADAVRGGLQMARLQNPNNDPDLPRVLEGIQVSAEQRTVRLRVRIAQDLMERLLARP